jgi:hypothetical protein
VAVLVDVVGVLVRILDLVRIMRHAAERCKYP